MSPVRPAARTTLADTVHEQLRDLICSGEFAPGEKLVIDRLAKDFNVSITPVRESLRRLQREGLVIESPYQGVVVAKVSHEQLRELFAVRGVLEGYAVAEACPRLSERDLAEAEAVVSALEDATARVDIPEFRRLNRRFHDGILQRAPSATLRDMIADITRNTERYRYPVIELDRNYLETVQAEHRELFALLRDRRTEDAEKLTRRHALTFVDHLIRRHEAETHAD